MTDTEKEKILQEEKEFKENFVIALAHKLRTPLNSARWVIETVLKKNEDMQEKDLLREGYNKIIESINIVSEILKSSAIESKDLLKGNKERVNICEIVDDIIANLNFLITEKETVLEYKKCDSAVIYGDRKMLDIALTNIIDNAFRYSPKGKVSIIIENNSREVILTVKDSGIGISKDDMAHLFEKFRRGKNAFELDPGENGTGLYTTKQIVELHNGTIKIDSELGKGTTVAITLPLD
jgi:two-component system phosphate regulon sensor histidine kinase PhoR